METTIAVPAQLADAFRSYTADLIEDSENEAAMMAKRRDPDEVAERALLAVLVQMRDQLRTSCRREVEVAGESVAIQHVLRSVRFFPEERIKDLIGEAEIDQVALREQVNQLVWCVEAEKGLG